MAAAALRAAVRQLFQPHLNPQISLGNAVFHNPALLTSSSRAARAGILEIQSPLLPRLAGLKNGASATLGSAGAAAPIQHSLGIARLARVMLNYLGVGVTAWAAGTELTGGARTAYASAPKRHAPVADPIPGRASWQSRSGPFFPSILTSSPPSTEMPRPPSPDASKAPLWEFLDGKPAPSERASSPVLSAAYDTQWARARSPPTIGLSGVSGVSGLWASTEATGPRALGVLEPIKHLGSSPKAVEKEAQNLAKGLRVGPQPSNSPSAGLGLLMEEPVPHLAPNIGWELVTSGLGWKGASLPSPDCEEIAPAVREAMPAVRDAMPAVREMAPAVMGPLGLEKVEELAESSSWSLVQVEAENAEEWPTVKESVDESSRQAGQLADASFHISSQGSRQPAAPEQSENRQKAGLRASGSEIRHFSGGTEESQSELDQIRACQSSPGRHVLRETVRSKALEDASPECPIRATCETSSPTFQEDRKPRSEAAPPKSPIRVPFEVPSEVPTKLPSDNLNSSGGPLAKIKAPVEMPVKEPAQTREDQLEKKEDSCLPGPSQLERGASLAAREAPPADLRDCKSLQRRVSAPIEIHQGRAEGRPCATSAPANRAAKAKRSDVSSRVDEVRLLGEALCHSQTRARRAEEAKAAVSVENDRLRQLLLLEAMQKNTWQICLAIQTSDASLLPIAVSPVASEIQSCSAERSQPNKGSVHANNNDHVLVGCEDSNGKGNGDGRSDFLDCIISIAFGVAIGVVCFGNWGYGWVILRSV